MTAMAHYGMYVNDTGDPGDPVDIGLEALSDVSATLGWSPLKPAHSIFSAPNISATWNPANSCASRPTFRGWVHRM